MKSPDKLLTNLPDDPEVGFITLVERLDQWISDATINDRNDYQEFYGETLWAFAVFHQLVVPYKRYIDASQTTISSWWDRFILDIHSLKVQYILHQNGREISDPNPDLPEEVIKDYEEARSVVSKSPRSAAALLRLGVQKLCISLGESGTNLNDDIGALVRKGLPVVVQQALDIVRVTGNNAVHPGTIDFSEDPAIARTLFQLLNFIANRMITEEKAITRIYEAFPKGALEQIKKRDAQAKLQFATAIS
jgi:hypothetical protein